MTYVLSQNQSPAMSFVNPDVQTGGFNDTSASNATQAEKDAKIVGYSSLATGVISALGAMKVDGFKKDMIKYQMRTRKALSDMRKNQMMTQFGEVSRARQRELDKYIENAQLSQAVSGLKREGTAVAAEETSMKNYAEDEAARRGSLISATKAEDFNIGTEMIQAKAARQAITSESNMQKISLLSKAAGVFS